MILINLLPHREAARKRRKEAFQVTMALSVVAGLLIAGAIYLWFQSMIENQQYKNSLLKNEISELDKQIKEIAGLEEEISSLRSRQKAVEDLQADRNMPVYLLNELVAQLPDGVYVTSLRQEGMVVTLQGMAQSNERISELLRNLSDGTPWFTKPELIEIIAQSVNVTAKEQRRVASFTARMQLMRSSTADKVAAENAGGIK